MAKNFNPDTQRMLGNLLADARVPADRAKKIEQNFATRTDRAPLLPQKPDTQFMGSMATVFAEQICDRVTDPNDPLPIDISIGYHELTSHNPELNKYLAKTMKDLPPDAAKDDDFFTDTLGKVKEILEAQGKLVTDTLKTTKFRLVMSEPSPDPFSGAHRPVSKIVPDPKYIV